MRTLAALLVFLLSAPALAQPAMSAQYLRTSGGKLNGPLRLKTITIAADDATPSISAGNVFTTSANTGATTITDLDNPHVDQVVWLCGGSNVNSSTIADAGNFKLNSAVTLGLDSCIVLWVRADNDYVELGRTNAGGWVGTATSALDMATYAVAFGTDPADTGDIRLENDTDICWEASPASTDGCLTMDSGEIFRLRGVTWPALAFGTGNNYIAKGTNNDLNFSVNGGFVAGIFDSGGITPARDELRVDNAAHIHWSSSPRIYQQNNNQVRIHNHNDDASAFTTFATMTESHATGDTLTDDEGNSLHFNAGASGVITFTLPTAAIGVCYDFAVNDTDDLKILAGAADYIRIGGTITGAAGYICMTAVGDSGRLCAIDTDTWFAIGAFVGTAPGFDTGC